MPPACKFAALAAVGPKPDELDRVTDLIDSIAAHEPGEWYMVLVDDGREDRQLAARFSFPPSVTAAAVPHDRSNQTTGYTKAKGICSVILTGMQWIARHAPDARFTLKLDTDALVIAPFAAKIAQQFDRNPHVGMIGAYDRTPNGDARDIARNGAIVRALHKPPIHWSRPRQALRAIRDRITGGKLADLRSHIDAARNNGYVYGEHCLGGAYAVSDELLRRMLQLGYLDNPSRWLSIDCPEDVMIGMYTKAAGLRHLGYVGTNEVFGVRHQGLPFDLPELVVRGYSVIHSIKNDPRASEDEVRRFFRDRRRATTPRH